MLPSIRLLRILSDLVVRRITARFSRRERAAVGCNHLLACAPVFEGSRFNTPISYCEDKQVKVALRITQQSYAIWHRHCAFPLARQSVLQMIKITLQTELSP